MDFKYIQNKMNLAEKQALEVAKMDIAADSDRFSEVEDALVELAGLIEEAING